MMVVVVVSMAIVRLCRSSIHVRGFIPCV
eukprot:SAG25_NODE_4156_length_878_cov_0.996149_2_plen_28_part_01